MKKKLKEIVELESSRFIDIRDIDSVCLTLGPYRNLTTLTAATLFLHPNCQVLNHAGNQIFGIKKILFLVDYNKKKLDRFIKFALKLSTKGKKGDDGGSITHSHAFDHKHGMKEVFTESDQALLKSDIRCLFWKESHRTSNLIRKERVDLGSIFERDARLRFLLPIRNPLDCAVSNIKTGHIGHFKQLSSEPELVEVVQAVLDEIFWVADLKEKYPDRFFYYFEHDISRNMLENLAQFLGLDLLEAWIDSALSVMTTTSHYDHDEELVRFFRNYIAEKGTSFPELSKGLLGFVEQTVPPDQ